MSKWCQNDVTMVTALVSSSLTHKMDSPFGRGFTAYYKCHITNVIFKVTNVILMSYLRLFPSAELFVPCFAYAEQTHYTQSGVLRTQPHIISQGACFEAHSGCGVELRCAKSRKAKLYIFLWQLFTLTGSFLQKHTALDYNDLNCLKRDFWKNCEPKAHHP